MISSVLEALVANDLKVMRCVHRWPAPRWIRVWMLCATRGGDGWIWYPMGAVILSCGGAHRFMAVGTALLAAAIGIAVFLWLKKRIGRRRPCALEPHCWAKLLPPDQFSFPSGHTITAFAVSICLIRFYPNLGAGLMFCAWSIAASRVILGMHFLTDVLAGATIGGLIAFLAIHLILALAGS